MLRALNTRTKHSKPATCFDENSQLAQHSQKTGNSFDFKNVSILHIPVSPMAPAVVSFLKRGVPIRKRTQSTFTLSFHVFTSISRIFRKFLAHALCIFVTYLPVLPSLVLFDTKLMKVAEVIETFYFLISVNATITISFYVMPDYNHGIFNHISWELSQAIMRRWNKSWG